MIRLLLIRHGETEWSTSRRHTGRTDIELTDRGRDEARAAARTLASWKIGRVFSSPLVRASETARIVDLGPPIEFVDDLMEWDYGEFEGVKTAEMRQRDERWSIWTSRIEEGEAVESVGDRADLALQRMTTGPDADVAVFAHGHLLSILIARWLGLAAVEGRRFKLDTATVSLLDTYREDRVLRVLNHRCGDELPHH